MVVLPAPPFWLTKAMTLAGSFFNVANDLFCWKRSAPTRTHRCSGMTSAPSILSLQGNLVMCFGLGDEGEREGESTDPAGDFNKSNRRRRLLRPARLIGYYRIVMQSDNRTMRDAKEMAYLYDLYITPTWREAFDQM